MRNHFSFFISHGEGTECFSSTARGARGLAVCCRRSEYPLSGAPLYYEDRFTGYYYVVFREYLAFYRLEGERILIDRVLFGRSDYIRILKSGTDH